MAATEYESVRANLAQLTGYGWTIDQLRALIDGHEAEVAFSTIARMVGGGRSKNACIGKARRIGLPPRARVTTTLRQIICERRRKARVVKAKAAPKPPRGPKRITDQEKAEALALPGLEPRLDALSTRQCKWPVGDPKDPAFAYCGRLKTATGPYCAAHHHCAVDHAGTARARKGRDRRFERIAMFAGLPRQGRSA